MEKTNIFNFCIYKVIFKDIKKPMYTVMDLKSKSTAMNFNKINEAAGAVECYFNTYKKEGVWISIDFHPLHDVEWVTFPTRCLSLTEEEKDEFWKCINKMWE